MECTLIKEIAALVLMVAEALASSFAVGLQLAN
jgi:hypothetical protein